VFYKKKILLSIALIWFVIIPQYTDGQQMPGNKSEVGIPIEVGDGPTGTIV
jgi:hypothetical protein